jgi:hypothetical protein
MRFKNACGAKKATDRLVCGKSNLAHLLKGKLHK